MGWCRECLERVNPYKFKEHEIVCLSDDVNDTIKERKAVIHFLENKLSEDEFDLEDAIMELYKGNHVK